MQQMPVDKQVYWQTLKYMCVCVCVCVCVCERERERETHTHTHTKRTRLFCEVKVYVYFTSRRPDHEQKGTTISFTRP